MNEMQFTRVEAEELRKRRRARGCVMPERPYDFNRDFRGPVGKAIAAYMAHENRIAENGRYVTKDGYAIGTLPVRMVIPAGEESVECKVYAVFSPTLAEMFDAFVRFAVENYAAAREMAARKAEK